MTSTINVINNRTSNLNFLSSTGFLDLNGKNILAISATTNAVNRLRVANNPSGEGPNLYGAGYNPSVDLILNPYNNGVVKIDGGGLDLLYDNATVSMPYYPYITADAIANRLVVQQTSLTTPVTNNNIMGAIQTVSNTFNNDQCFYFILNNTYINANSVVLASASTASVGYNYSSYFQVGTALPSAGYCYINMMLIEGSSLTTQLTINFVVL
jgi:hypothetical protein